jgi:hypothetical protein
MALTPLRNARGVDGGVAGCWLLDASTTRSPLSQEQPQQWLHDLFLSNEKNRAQERIVTGRWRSS